MNQTARRRSMRPELLAAAAALWLVASVLAIPVSAQDSDGESGADADTGWVEIGGAAGAGTAVAAPFGDDDPFADLPTDDEGEEKDPGGKLRPYLDYNRVDQYTLGFDMLYKPTVGLKPGLRIRVARAFQRQDDPGDGVMLYDMGLTQPLVPSRAIRLDVALYEKTDDDHFGQIGGFENALATWALRWDFRDWFQRTGFTGGLSADFGTRWSASARWSADDYTSITRLADGIAPAFRQDEPMRENPAIDDGRLQSVTLAAGYDSRSSKDAPTRGMWHRIEMETAGGALEGDFTFHRWMGDFRAYVSPSPSHRLKTRVMLGTTGADDALPLQRTFAIGGVGTLRATPFRQFRGNHLFLWNADWAWEVLRRSSKNAAVKTALSVVAFSDLGVAWRAPEWDLARQKPAWNVGLGLGTSDERFRVYAGKDVRDSNAAVHWTVRIAQSY